MQLLLDIHMFMYIHILKLIHIYTTYIDTYTTDISMIAARIAVPEIIPSIYMEDGNTPVLGRLGISAPRARAPMSMLGDALMVRLPKHGGLPKIRGPS